MMGTKGAAVVFGRLLNGGGRASAATADEKVCNKKEIKHKNIKMKKKKKKQEEKRVCASILIFLYILRPRRRRKDSKLRKEREYISAVT